MKHAGVFVPLACGTTLVVTALFTRDIDTLHSGILLIILGVVNSK